MRNFIVNSIIIALLLFGASAVFAQEEPNIEFPVGELGNCQSKEECKTYCDTAEHMASCINFAEKHGLIRGAELEEAKKVVQALREGAQLPGGCRNKAECQAYCEDSAHIQECLAFAEAAGFLSADELAEAKRIAPFMMRGEMPGGCRNRETCEAYCSQESHTAECAAFFEKAGFISAEEAEMFRKTKGRGPGGCQGRESCDAFCNDSANQQACFDFAKQYGLIEEEELSRMEEGIGTFRTGLQNAPPEVAQCLKERVEEEVLAKIEAGAFLPNRELGEKMRQCFQEHMPKMIEQGIQERAGGEAAPPEAMGCVQRILGDTRQLQGPPTAEQEQRIRAECFPQSPSGGFDPPTGGPEGSRDEFQQQFQQQFQEEFQQQAEQQYQQQYQEEFQRQLEQQSAPSSRLPRESFLGAVWEAMKPALSRFIPALDKI